ncbi:MAG: MarR family transcriptional regulator [Methanomassiliicoccales archaeon]|nr:MarR family transcriptional regulator [Methanomassiliicoccales archaeon]
MKTAMSAYALTPHEIRVMRTLAHGSFSIGELATRMNLSDGSASKIVSGLFRKGFISRKREGLRIIVEPSSNSHARNLTDLILAYAQIPWENVLAYSSLPILSRDLGGAEFPTSISQSTRWRVEHNLGLYGLPPGKRNLTLSLKIEQFINAHVEFARRQLADKILPKGSVMVWAKGFNFIAKTKKGEVNESSCLKKTAISAFPGYGIRFITDSEYFFYDPFQRNLTLEDIIIHTILIDPSSRTNIGYATLLLLKEKSRVSLESLLQKAQGLYIEEDVKDVISLIQTHKHTGGLSIPGWEEIQELAELYEVKIEH